MYASAASVYYFLYVNVTNRNIVGKKNVEVKILK